MRAVVVAKTRMSDGYCIGSILGNKNSARLIPQGRNNFPLDTEIEIGNVLSIEYLDKPNLQPPHTEDVIVQSWKVIGNKPQDLSYIELLDKMDFSHWQGSPEELFGGCLWWTANGSGHVSPRGKVPSRSVGFWISDEPLKRMDYNGKVHYCYPPKVEKLEVCGILQDAGFNYYHISYVGLQEPVDMIPQGTLLRVSLSRWWKPPNSNFDEACYLQLSGWYDLKKPINEMEDDNDLPF